MVVAPIHEKEKKERLKEKEMKDRFKSSGSHKVCIVARVDSVPENHFNLKVLLNSQHLHELSKDFRISCDLKLIDILLGIQSCSSLHPCPYCEGYKINRSGEKTNKKGIWVKGNPISPSLKYLMK